MRIPLTSVLLVAALALTTGSAAAEPQRAAIAHPTGADEVVLRVTSGGGFVPVEFNLRALPSFTLYGDGTIIVPGAITMIFPGPAIYPLVRSKLSERQVQALLLRARQAGLLAAGRVDYGDMGAIGVADAPTTTLLVNAAGRHVKREAYALGIAGGGQLAAAQIAARKALARFVATLPHGLAGGQYTPHAIAVYVGPFRGPVQPGATRVVWPLKSNLATAGKPVSSGLQYRCMVVGGANATTLLATLRKANEQSRWRTRGNAKRVYQVIARPLLPDQRSCR
jgi:hypothetical protein